jgi:hypothetical protein
MTACGGAQQQGWRSGRRSAARRLDRHGDERGAIAILVALSVSGLLVVAAMVMDFGLVRIDRQIDKSAADSAAVAGLHALNAGDGKPRPYVGVCTALRYLRVNNERFAGMSDTSGTWTTGAGIGSGNGCTDATLRRQVCKPGSTATWAKFTWSGTWAGAPLSVTIQSGYALTGTTGWSEDSLVTASADSDDGAQGCDQLAVVVTQARKPGFGSLATAHNLVSSVRSVGRVSVSPGGYAPAMLLLKQTGCPVLQSGAAGGGSFIHVLGAISTNGISQPGTIHSDSDASGCSGGSNQNLFLGKGTAGIAAYAAPLVSDVSRPDPTKPGMITSVAGDAGLGLNFVRDLAANVYGSAALNTTGAPAATKVEPGGRSIVTRQFVDDRYIAGIRTATAQANNVFSTINPLNALTLGVTRLLTDCKPTQLALNLLNLTATSTVFIDCTTNAGFGGTGTDLTINAGTVIFNGRVAPSASLDLPNASRVYIGGVGSGDSLVLGGGGAKFRMHTAGLTDPVTGRCTSGNSPSKAMLFVKDGDIKESTGSNLFQLCKTTVVMMAGRYDSCVPATSGTAPTATPCNGAAGTGQFTQNGGDIDWTAPDQYDVMTLPNGQPDPAKAAAWSDPNGLEDLALWSESGVTSSASYNMTGGGVFNVRGVFMVPNADPFTIGGGASMSLSNAQFIASSIALNGNTTNITMAVDPNSAVTLPKLDVVGLVR